MSLADYEDFYYGACLAGDAGPADRLEAGLGGDEATGASGSRATRRCGCTRPGTDIKLGIAGRKFIPCDGRHNMPDGEFFTGPVEDSVEGEVTFHLPAVIGGREVSGVRLRFEARQGRRRQRRARRGVPDQAARHRRGRPPPRRAGDRHQLRDRSRHPRGPARREDRRHRPHGGRPQLPGVRRHQRVRRPHRPGLRPAPRRQARGRRRASCRKTASSSSSPAMLGEQMSPLIGLGSASRRAGRTRR